jgi:cysteine desulfurase
MLDNPPPSRAYFDHAATTPVLPEVLDVLVEQLRRLGNPSSLHASGRDARRVVEESRESIAHCLGARPGDVVFTSGGTEADNLAVKGIAHARRAADPARVRVLASAVEHHAVLDSVEWLAGQGFDVRLVDVDEVGRIRTDQLRDLLAEDPGAVALISCMWANNEVGTIQPLDEVVAAALEACVPVHSDAVQAVSHLPVNFTASGLDAMTVTAHKLGGPVGVGALLTIRDLEVAPIVHGGGQERQIRSGTLDAPAIAAFARALEMAVGVREQLHDRLERLRAELVERVIATVPGVLVNGDARAGHRLPGIAHLGFPGCEGDSLLMLLDAAGIECSTGSACTAGVPQPSHVLLAMGQPEDVARGSLRFSLGHTSTREEVDRLVAVLPGAVERARAAAGLLSPGAR